MAVCHGSLTLNSVGVGGRLKQGSQGTGGRKKIRNRRVCPGEQTDWSPPQRALETFRRARRLQEAGGEEELDTDMSREDGEPRVRSC